MYCKAEYYVKFENGYNKIHIGDPHLLCRPETPNPEVFHSNWKGPFLTPEEAEEAVNHYKIHHCRGCFNPRLSSEDYRRSREILSPTGGQSRRRNK